MALVLEDSVTGVDYEGGGGTAEVTLTLPGGAPSSGDLLVAVLYVYLSNSRPTPSGWTEVAWNQVDDSSMYIQVLARQAGSSEPAAHTFTANSTYSVILALLARFSGAADPSSEPPDVETSGTVDTATSPSITVNSDGSIVIWTAFRSYATTQFDAPGSSTDFGGENTVGDSDYFCCGWGYEAKNAGASGTAAFTVDPTWGGDGEPYTIEIKPAAAAGANPKWVFGLALDGPLRRVVYS